MSFQLRSLRQDQTGQLVAVTRSEQWQPKETAIIVCDVWDYHHSLNAVRRLNEFVPRLNQVLSKAREQGVTIIHSPSDCMAAYAEHPARQRAIAAPTDPLAPQGIQSWCSFIPAEEQAVYPIDQSDGGDDDDPQEHAEWAKKLAALGRNPNLPWQRQTDALTIDSQLDYISDRGDEVWNILSERGIKNVILTGVHTNMCVLGRPFGLRQMARNGKNVVLMRDMTDTMYNPARWPYVNHFEGTRRIIAHIERFVCPTISSDQILGGEEFRFQGDDGTDTSNATQPDSGEWLVCNVPEKDTAEEQSGHSHWYRCVVRIPSQWVSSSQDTSSKLTLALDAGDNCKAWLNGAPLPRHGDSFLMPSDAVVVDDWNLIVVQLPAKLTTVPTLMSGERNLPLAGRWQTRQGAGESPTYANMPLPAKFGGGSDICFEPEDGLWQPRAFTQVGQFTAGIEGPSCDAEGNVFAVNFASEGTIGRVSPAGNATVFLQLPEGSIGNGIQFSPEGHFFVADYTGHNVLRVNPETRHVDVHAHHAGMNQPNDLALAPDGKTLFASDPNWTDETGKLWRIDADGSVHLLADQMGTTNGIDVSPDGQTLYVNESVQRRVWAFAINAKGELENKRLVHQFSDHAMDGMRCDLDGNLYITRYGKGTVVKMSPSGEVLREIPVLGARPSNLCFGGPDGRTLYVTEVEYQRLVSFRIDRPGR